MFNYRLERGAPQATETIAHRLSDPAAKQLPVVSINDRIDSK